MALVDAADALAAHADTAGTSAGSIRVFKYVIMVVLLVITVASSLAPLWISQHGTSSSRNLLTRKLPFATAGVFIGMRFVCTCSHCVKRAFGERSR